jgi:hypothetical protein
MKFYWIIYTENGSRKATYASFSMSSCFPNGSCHVTLSEMFKFLFFPDIWWPLTTVASQPVMNNHVHCKLHYRMKFFYPVHRKLTHNSVANLKLLLSNTAVNEYSSFRLDILCTWIRLFFFNKVSRRNLHNDRYQLQCWWTQVLKSSVEMFINLKSVTARPKSSCGLCTCLFVAQNNHTSNGKLNKWFGVSTTS